MDWLLAPVRWLGSGTTLHRTLSFGYIRQRWMRTGLVVASIALGVATLVATRALNANLDKAGRDAVNPLSGLCDLVVTNGQTGVPRDRAAAIEKAHLPGVKAVVPMVYGRVLIPELHNRSVLVIGLHPPAELVKKMQDDGKEELPHVIDDPNIGVRVELNDEGVKLFRQFAGWSRLTGTTDFDPSALDKVPLWASPDLARDLAEAPDAASDFRLRLADHERRVVLAGTLTPHKAAGAVERYVVYLDDRVAAKLIYPERSDYVSRINLFLDDPKQAEAVRGRVQEIVGPAYHAQTLEQSFAAVRDITAGLQLGFAIGGAGALVIGLFLVYNALSVSVAERRHDIGILRSVGATRGQIAALFVGEAAVLGLVGALLGLPLGYGLAKLALGPISRMLSDVFAPMETPEVNVSTETLLIAVAAGVATTILAALIPALQASMEEPADAVRRVPVALNFLYRITQGGAALLLIGAGFACVVGRAYMPLRYGVFFGIIFVLVGVLVATPLLAALLSRLLRPLFRRVFGLEGRLAADNLARSPGRTGIVIAALAATGALLVMTAGYIRSTEHAVLQWLDRSVAADLFVTSGGSLADKASELVPMNEDMAEELRALPGVEAALPVRMHPLEFRGRIVLLIAVDADAFAAAPDLNPLARNLPRLREPDTALVSTNFAALHGVHVGDRLSLDGMSGPLEVTVIDTVLDYTWNRGTILVNRSWYQEHYHDHQVDIFDVYVKKDADHEAVRRQIRERWGQQEAVHVITRAEARDALSSGLQRIYGVAYAQQTIVGLVALLGVISALFISVLQRRRELGLLRAVGASRAQVLRSVLTEAFQMGVIGGVLGFGVGLLLEWYIINILVLDEAGYIFPQVVPWAAAGVVFGASVLTAALVGLWPAWHATRIRIAEAIAYE